MPKYIDYGSLEYYQQDFETTKANLCLVLVGLRPLIDKPDPDKLRSQLRAVVKAFDVYESAESAYFSKLKEIEEEKQKQEEDS